MTGQNSAAGPSYAKSGWIEAGVYAFIVGLLSLVYAIGVRLGVHTIAFILYAMVFSALAIVAITGPGSEARAIMLYPTSWVIGMAIILMEVFYYLILTFVSPAHGNVLVRIGIPIALLAGWLVFARRPARLAGLAAAVIVVAIVYVVMISPEAARLPTGLCGLLCGVIMVVRGFAAEVHPWNRAARTPFDKLRVTGLLLLVTSVISLALTVLASGVIAAGLMPPLRIVPTLAELMHLPTILLGGLLGGLLLTAMSYLGFSVVLKIGTENLMAMMAFTPLTSWIFQEIGVALGLISVPSPDVRLISAMVVIIASVLTILWSGRIARAAARR